MPMYTVGAQFFANVSAVIGLGALMSPICKRWINDEERHLLGCMPALSTGNLILIDRWILCAAESGH